MHDGNWGNSEQSVFIAEGQRVRYNRWHAYDQPLAQHPTQHRYIREIIFGIWCSPTASASRLGQRAEGDCATKESFQNFQTTVPHIRARLRPHPAGTDHRETD